MSDHTHDDSPREPSPDEKEIFLAALDVTDQTERAGLIEKLCRGDASLQARISELLKEAEDEDTFLKPDPDRIGEILDPNEVKTEHRDAILESGKGYQPGEVIGRYKLLQKIGEGGGGTVYMADQTEPVKRRVALKVIKLGMDTRQVIARFEAERQALAMMDHPCIAKVFDAGATASGRLYFVMELVGGVPITSFCDKNKLNTTERLKLFVQVCEAVQHAHQKGIIHRDLKPGNILVTMLEDRPIPKVIDFGIAKATQQELTEKTLFTHHGHFLGTPAYMSPEQAQITGYDIDTRSDIYSLGVLLYELLTGKTPFDTTKLLQAGYEEIRRKIAEDEPPKPSTRLSTLDEGELTELANYRQAEPRRISRIVRGDLDWIVMKALEKDRRRRYDTASGFGLDVGRFLDQQPVTAGPPGFGYKLRKFARRNKSAIIMSSALLLTLLAGAGVSIWQAVRASAEAKRASHAETTAKEEAVKAKAQEQIAIGNWRKAQTETGRAWVERAEYYADKPGQEFNVALLAARAIGYKGFGRDLQDAQFSDAFPVLFEEAEDDYQSADELIRKQGTMIRPVWSSPVISQHLQHYGGINCVAVDQEGKTLASGSSDHTIKLWDMETGELHRTLFGHRSSVTSIVFSPDGKTLASAGFDKDVKLWDPDSGKLQKSLEGHEERITGLDFSPDGKTLAGGCDDWTVKLWDLESGKLRESLEGHSGPVVSISFSPDGSILASGSRDESVRLWDMGSGNLRQILTDLGLPVSSITISPDGETLASGGKGRGPIKIWGLENGELRHSLGQPGSSGYGLSIGPDGKTLASIGADKTINFWDLESGSLLNSLPHPGSISSLVFSPDGASLAGGGGDGAVCIWDLETGKLCSPTAGHRVSISKVAISPDGKILVGGGTDGAIKLWNAHDGTLRHTLVGHAGYIAELAISPDGRTLASVSGDDTVRIWDLQSGALRHTLTGHERSVGSVDFSPDGLTVASGSFDETIKLWDLAGGELRQTLAAGSAISAVRFSVDGRSLAGGGFDNKIRLWDIKSGELRLSLSGHKEFVSSLAFGSSGKLLVSGGDDHAIKIWDLETGEERLSFSGHTSRVTSVAVSPDGKTLLSAGFDQTVKVWDVESGKELSSLIPQTSSIYRDSPSRAIAVSIAICPDGKTFLSGSTDRTLKLWDLGKGELLQTLSGHKSSVLGIAISPDGKILASGSRDQSIKIQDLESGEELCSLTGHTAGVSSVAIDPTGEIFASGSFDRTIKIWNLKSGEEIRSLTGFENYIASLAISPKRGILASGSPNGTITLWELASGKEFGQLNGHRDLIKGLAFTPDGKTLVSGSFDKSVKLWDWEEGTLRKSLDSHTDHVTGVAIDKRGELLASSSKDASIKLWDLTDGQELRSLAGLVECVAFSPDGKTVVGGGQGNTIALWDTGSGTQRQTMTGSRNTRESVNTVAITPDGKTLISGDEAGEVKLWDLRPVGNDLASYVSQGWVKIDGRKITWSEFPADNLYKSREFGFLNVPPASHLRILGEKQPASEIDRELFWAFSRSRNWNSCLAIFPSLKGAPAQSKAIRNLIRWLEEASRSDQLTSGVAAFRLGQLEALDAIASDSRWDTEMDRLRARWGKSTEHSGEERPER